jgi:hypothetical protein
MQMSIRGRGAWDPANGSARADTAAEARVWLPKETPTEMPLGRSRAAGPCPVGAPDWVPPPGSGDRDAAIRAAPAARHFLLLLLFSMAFRAQAGNISLTWDPVYSPALAGYTIHYGPAASYYTTSIPVGNATTTTVSHLPEGATYHFAVTAYDWSGVPSRYSNEVVAIVTSGPPIVLSTIEVIEYYHEAFDHYFVTGTTTEIALLDSGSFAGWTRTGYGFSAYAASSLVGSDVCRFFSTSFGAKSSHFYTPIASECRLVKGNPDWQFEGAVFRVEVPDSDGSCAEGTGPVYRLYNDGDGGAPNHRYTSNLYLRARMLEHGWIAEGYGPLGVIMCAPL